MTVTFSQFASGSTPRISDYAVGLRTVNGVVTNEQFVFDGASDSSGNNIVLYKAAVGIGTPVNYLEFFNSFTGNAVIMQAAGTDTNISIDITPKGSGTVNIPAAVLANPLPVTSGGTGLSSTTANQLLYSSSNDVIAGLATANNGVLITSAGGVPSIGSTLPSAVQGNITTVGALSSGSLASGFTPVTVPLGGTGNTTFTAYSVICAGTTATGTFQNVSGLGTNGYVLTSNGAGALPTWQSTGAITGVSSVTGTLNEIDVSPTTGACIVSIDAAYVGQASITTLGTIATGTWNGSVIDSTYGGTGVDNSGSTITVGGNFAMSGAHTFTGTLTGNTAVTFPTSGTLATTSSTVASITGTANEIAASASTGAVTLSIPSTFIAPGTIQATTSSAATSFLLNGATDGVISILPQAHAGTYNFNLPITAGTSGYLLTSAGGAGSAMTWSNIASIAVSAIAGTSNEITASASTGSVTLSIPSTFIAPGTIQATTSSAAASFLVNGSTDGVITIKGQAHAGTYEFDLPTTAGTSGYVLTSAGGAGAPMTWTNLGSATVSSIAGTTNEIAASASTGAVTLSIPNNPVLPGTGGVTIPGGNTAARAGGAGTIRLNSQANVFEGTIDGATWATFESSSTGVISVSGDASTISVSPTTGLCVVSILNTYTGQSSITTLGTIGTGTWQGTNVALGYGGTNAALTASNGGIFYSTASAGAILAGTATANQVLLSGSSTTPAWSTATYPATTTINQLLYSSSANTIAGLATATTAVLTTSSGVPTWASELSLALGGTNANLTASNGGIFYSTASAGAILAGTSTAGQLLTSGASTTPAWTTSTYPATNAVNTLLYASSANVMAALATANSGVLITSGAGVPSISSTLPSGITLVAPVLGTPASGTLTNCTGLPVAGGGTGVATMTTAYAPVCAGTTATGALQVASTGLSTSGYVLTSNGSSSLPSFQAAPGSAHGSLVAVTAFTSSGTWTANGATNSVIVDVVGGGGGGGGAGSASACSGGGGGGGYARLYTSSQGASQTVTIGGAGSAGTNSGSAGAQGGTGGTSSFGALATATGGIGGFPGTGVALGQGGAGGLGASGTFNCNGGPGISGIQLAGATSSSGAGGGTTYGGGGVGVSSGGGNAGGVFGGGGSGAYQLSNTNGGAGAKGLVVVYEYT